ncbi:MAG: Na+/H+ antiporter subunit D [Chloroflexi bacterium]|nr:MAG: Na+/H+ antiporter subunit D [Chloroflexota bacterium]
MRTELLILLPILIPLSTAILSVMVWQNVRQQRVISLVGSVGLLGAAVGLFTAVYSQNTPLVVQMGNWAAPFGITLVADLFSAIMVVLAGLMGMAVAIYAIADIDARRERLGFHPLYHILLMGVSGSFLTGDIFNLYVWFEVMLIASFVLLALGGDRNQLEGAIKYMTLNLLASAAFLAAVGILYGLTGTLNMADLRQGLANAPQGLVLTLAMLFLVAFGIKAALFPLFGWLPAAYHTPPTAISAIFAGLLTKVGVYAIIRVFTLLFVQDVSFTHARVLLVIAGLTMVTGVFGAATQTDFRRILSFHIVSQIGYMIMGLALYTPLALAGAIFYISHHIIVKTNLFLVSGVVNRTQGSFQLKKLGGLYRAQPMLAVLFLIPALSLAGIPPLSGFWAKFTLVRAGLETEQYLIVATSLFVGLLTLYSMTKIWNEAFWKAQPEAYQQTEEVPRRDWLLRVAPVGVLAAFTLIIGFFAEPLFQLSMMVAEQLLNPSVYVTAVLQGG